MMRPPGSEGRGCDEPEAVVERRYAECGWPFAALIERAGSQPGRKIVMIDE